MKKKSIGVMLGIIITFVVLNGCSAENKIAGTNNSVSKANISNKGKNDKTIVKNTFFTKGKNEIEKFAVVMDKYQIKYNKLDDKVSDFPSGISKGYSLNSDSDQDNINDGSLNTYENIAYSVSFQKNKKNGQRVLNLTLIQNTIDGNFDINKATFLKDTIVAISGDNNYNFNDLNKRINEVINSSKKGLDKTTKYKTGDFTEKVSGQVTNDKKEKSRTIFYNLSTDEEKID